MAPFVELEWGRQAKEVMEEIKHIFDPHHLLNPGVIINPVSAMSHRTNVTQDKVYWSRHNVQWQCTRGVGGSMTAMCTVCCLCGACGVRLPTSCRRIKRVGMSQLCLTADVGPS
jgi:hypothetical protein